MKFYDCHGELNEKYVTSVMKSALYKIKNIKDKILDKSVNKYYPKLIEDYPISDEVNGVTIEKEEIDQINDNFEKFNQNIINDKFQSIEDNLKGLKVENYPEAHLNPNNKETQ